jgi:hypothetical protein
MRHQPRSRTEWRLPGPAPFEQRHDDPAQPAQGKRQAERGRKKAHPVSGVSRRTAREPAHKATATSEEKALAAHDALALILVVSHAATAAAPVARSPAISGRR